LGCLGVPRLRGGPVATDALDMPDPLDPLIHVPARLRIVVTLAALPDGDALSFSRLQDMIGLTPGNLITHLRKLEDADYVCTDKTGNGAASRTTVALTSHGRAALDAYTHALRDLLHGAETVPRVLVASDRPPRSPSTTRSVRDCVRAAGVDRQSAIARGCSKGEGDRSLGTSYSAPQCRSARSGPATWEDPVRTDAWPVGRHLPKAPLDPSSAGHDRHRLVTRVVDSRAVGGEAVEDFVGGLVPDVGAGVVVPAGDPGADGGDELSDRAVGAALDPFGGELGEPALDEVEPGAVGRGEVQ